jgi:Lon protease-like protein
LKSYLQANSLTADWDRINGAGNERLVNTLSILSPYGAEEKQALLEAPDLRSRAEALVALAEMELATRDDGSGTTLQ